MRKQLESAALLKLGLTMPMAPQLPRLTFTGKRRFLFLWAGLLLLVQGCATSPPKPAETAYAQAKTAYLTHDYRRALAIVGPRAIAGEPWAEYTLGYMYHYGQGVAVDRRMAKQWIQRAAKQGYAPAQHALARIATPLPPMDANGTSPANEGVVAGQATGPDKQQREQPSPQATTTTTVPAPAADTGPTGALQPAQTGKGIKDHGWIAAQDPQQYTVQLIGFSSEMAAIRYIHDNHLESQAAYYSVMRAGRPWFGVVYGKFPSKDAARQALGRLPSTLRGASPWVRSFGDIQALSAP